MRIIKTNLFFLLLILSLLSYGGCGYKLRNTQLDMEGQIISLSFDPNEINLDFINQLKRELGIDRIYLNKVDNNSNFYIEILEHNTIRYSAALGTGARTKEARLDYFLKISMKKKIDKEEKIVEIRDSSNYSFDESKILGIEEIEKRIKKNFFKNAINRINFAMLDLVYEDT